MEYKRWTSEEVDLLKNLYPNVRIKDLVNKFPYRNADTIVVKALSLGLSSAKLWQKEENEILKRYFIDSPRDELLKFLPKRTWLAIIAQGERMGLRRKIDKPRLKVNESYFRFWSSNMAYILGFILADGCIIKGTYKGYSDSLKFGVQVSDIDILEKIRKEFKAEHKISLFKNAAYFCVTSQRLVDDLKKLNVAYRKSLNEIIPNVPPKYNRDFIRGIVDGDGGISINRKGQPAFMVCGGEETVTFIRNYLLSELEVYSKLGRREYSEAQRNFLYEIKYKSSSALKILAYLYSDSCLYLDRKYKLAKRCLRIKINERKNFNGRRHV